MKKHYLTFSLLFLCNLLVAQVTNSSFFLKKEKQQPSNTRISEGSKLRNLRLQESISGLDILSYNDLNTLLNSPEINLEFIGIEVSATLEELDYKSHDNYTWTGFTEDFDNLVQFTVYEGELHGQVRYNGQSYEIQPFGESKSLLLKYNMPYLNSKTCKVDHTFTSEEPVLRTKPLTRSAGQTTSDIDVLVLYSRAAEATGINPRTVAMNSIAQWNSARNNSRVFARFNLVGVERFADFSEGFRPLNDARGISALPEVQTRRNANEADLVLMLTNGTRGEYDGTFGVVANIGPMDNFAYGLVQIANASSTITFAHEAGHLMGGRHEVENDPTPGDQHGESWEKGALFWKKRFGSVMNRQETNDFLNPKPIERTLHFSNPFVENRNKDTGIVGVSYNARVFNVNGRIVCDFRGDQNALSASISGNGTARSGDLLTFSPQLNGGNAPFSYTWTAETANGGRLQGGTQRNLSINMPANESMIVTLNVRDSQGRTATAGTYVQNTNQNGGGGNPIVFFDKENEIELEEINEVFIFPNPVSDLVQIAIPQSFSQLELVDLTGKQIFFQNLIPDENIGVRGFLKSLDLTDLPTGVYLLKLSGEESAVSHRIIKD